MGRDYKKGLTYNYNDCRLQEMKSGFASEGSATGRDPLLVTAAVGGTKPVIDTAYEVQDICR